MNLIRFACFFCLWCGTASLYAGDGDWQGVDARAAALLEKGEYRQAEAVAGQAVVLAEKNGAAYPDVANCLARLAEACDEQLKHTQAEPLYQRALKITEEACGPNHPAVATCLINLAEN